jgi:hypothetical protein
MFVPPGVVVPSPGLGVIGSPLPVGLGVGIVMPGIGEGMPPGIAPPLLPPPFGPPTSPEQPTANTPIRIDTRIPACFAAIAELLFLAPSCANDDDRA